MYENNTHTATESIQLSLPLNAAYVSAARLTASSIAHRLLFDVDEIEDIKAAVSEACTVVIRQAAFLGENKEFKVVFNMKPKVLTIYIEISAQMSISHKDQEMGLMMIKALMDEFELVQQSPMLFSMTMVKRHKELMFD